MSLIAQLFVLAFMDVKLTPSAIDPASDGDHVKQCLVFLPFLTFALMVDIQILVSTYQYKPVAFKHLPCSCARPFMLTIGVLTLLMTVVAYVFCLLVFGGLSKDPSVRQMVFVCFLVKALTWSPFLALEFYDTLFEQVYHDVQFQLNVIKPNTGASRTVSPRLPKSSLAVIQEVNGNQALISSEMERNDRSLGNSGGREDSKNSLLKPMSSIIVTQSADRLGLKSSNNAAGIMQVQPVEVRNEQEMPDLHQNRIVIQEEDGLDKSITDSNNDLRSRGGLNLTEYERKVRRENGLPSQLEPSNENFNDQTDGPEVYGF